MKHQQTGDWIDATSEDWVSSFDLTTGAIVIDYSQVDYDTSYPTPEIVTIDLRITRTDPRSTHSLKTLIDEFTITFSDNCSTDTLTATTNNLGEVQYLIDSGISSPILIDFSQLTAGCPLSSTLEFYNSVLKIWEAYDNTAHPFVNTWDSVARSLTLSTNDFATYSSDPTYEVDARITVTSTSTSESANTFED